MRHDHRKYKKRVRNLGDELNRLGYFEDCFYHPCKITKLHRYQGTAWSIYDADVDGESLVEPGRLTGCSLFNCAPLPLSEKEALERAAHWKEHGELSYMLKYVYKPESHEEVIEWYKERDKKNESK